MPVRHVAVLPFCSSRKAVCMCQCPVSILLVWYCLRAETVLITLYSNILGAQARVSDVAPARSCASVERHGACPSAGSFSVRLEGPATLWGAPTPYLVLATPSVPLP